MDDDRARRAVAALGGAFAYNVLNPFAQSTRLIRSEPQTAPLGESTPGFEKNVHEKNLKQAATTKESTEVVAVMDPPEMFTTPATAKRKRAPKQSPVVKKRSKAQENLMNRIDDDESMDVEGEQSEVQPMALRAGGQQGSTGIAKETPLSKFNPFLGIPDTANVILPWTGYMTIVTPNDQTSVRMEFRVNTPYDFVVSQLTAPTPGGTVAAGRFNSKPKFDTVNGTWPAANTPYPVTTGPGANTGEAPWYRGYYDKIYQTYACLGTEYKLTILNPQRLTTNRDVVCFYGVDSFSAASNARRFPASSPYAAKYWPDLNWKTIRSQGDNTTDGSITVISGQYKTGSASRNTQNDEDLKTWTAVGATPSLSENLVLAFANAEFNESNFFIPLMIKIEMKFIVQYKDKRVEARYPVSGQTPFAINVPTDILTLV